MSATLTENQSYLVASYTTSQINAFHVDNLVELGIVNFTNREIGVLYADGRIVIIPPRLDQYVGPPCVMLHYTFLNNKDITTTTNNSSSQKTVYNNNFERVILLEAFYSGPVTVNELNMVIAVGQHISELGKYKKVDRAFMSRVVNNIMSKYSVPSDTGDHLTTSAFSPISVIANCHDPNINDLYVVVNDIPCSVKVMHDPEMAEALILAVRQVDGTIRQSTVEDWKWTSGVIRKIDALDHNWIIGTNREDVIVNCHKRVTESKSRICPNEMKSMIDRVTAEKDKEIETLNDDIKTHLSTIKRLNEKLKVEQERADTAESETRFTVKQQMAYNDLLAQRAKYAFERESRDYEVNNRVYADELRLKRERQEIEAERIRLENERLTLEAKAKQERKTLKQKHKQERRKEKEERRSIETKSVLAQIEFMRQQQSNQDALARDWDKHNMEMRRQAWAFDYEQRKREFDLYRSNVEHEWELRASEQRSKWANIEFEAKERQRRDMEAEALRRLELEDRRVGRSDIFDLLRTSVDTVKSMFVPFSPF